MINSYDPMLEKLVALKIHGKPLQRTVVLSDDEKEPPAGLLQNGFLFSIKNGVFVFHYTGNTKFFAI